MIVRLWRRLTQLPKQDPFYQGHDAYLDKTTSISIYNCQLNILTVSQSDWRVWLGLGLWYLKQLSTIVQCWIECSDVYTCMYIYFFLKYLGILSDYSVTDTLLAWDDCDNFFLWLYTMKYESIPPMQYITVKTGHLILHLIIFHVL